MSRSITAFATDIAALRQVVGGRGVSLSKQLVGASARQLVTGTVPADPVEATHALEEVCAAIGRRLPNTTLSPIRSELLEKVDLALDHASITPDFRIQRIIYRGAPVPLPPTLDYPSVGYVDWPELAHAVGAMPTDGDSTVDAVLQELEDWLDVAARTTRGIVGFYY